MPSRATAALGTEREALPSDPRMRLVLSEIRHDGVNDDEYFDRILPDWARGLSRLHWTPVQVARTAAQLLTEGRKDAFILDVGSGAGKFCLVGASVTDARFFGIEHRPHLHALSETLARRYRASRASFMLGEMRHVEWAAFDGVYLYNPFQEYRTPQQRIDSTLELRRTDYERYIKVVQEKLAGMEDGTRVVTYHGFGGVMPEGYRRALSEHCYRGPLECWVKEDQRPGRLANLPRLPRASGAFIAAGPGAPASVPPPQSQAE